ncbi:MAG: hypothetical protein Q6J33_00200 [Gloeomargarita sp. DG_2_bins_126]
MKGGLIITLNLLLWLGLHSLPMAYASQSNRKLALNRLSQQCLREVRTVDAKIKTILQRPNSYQSPSLLADKKGNLLLSFYLDEYLLGNDLKEEISAVQVLSKACPELQIILLSANMGAGQRWYMKQTKFSKEHSRDSGSPNDEKFYWNEIDVFDYQP